MSRWAWVAGVLGAGSLLAGCHGVADRDRDGYPIDTDCNDDEVSIHPDAAEVCDGVDQDCDREVDEDLVFADWWPDVDADGYGDAAFPPYSSCNPIEGYSEDGSDCDDRDASIHPGAEETCDGVDQDCDSVADDGLEPSAWYPDEDGDGFGSAIADPEVACAAPPGAVDDHTDCDDAAAGVHPGAAESCDGTDEDCDGQVDEGLPTGAWYPDEDGDGYGDAAAGPVEACAGPTGHVEAGGDCDDGDPAVFPDAAEVCDGADQDCDGGIDEGLPTEGWYPDADGDGHGAVGSEATHSCGEVEGASTRSDDCNDLLAGVHPGAPETCDGTDEDCDGSVDEGVPTQAWYPDADHDGAGDAGAPPLVTCGTIEGMETTATDCDDGDPSVRPGAAEACDDADQDCDGEVDEGLATTAWYPDADADGAGDASAPAVVDCEAPAGAVASATDCDDLDPAIRPGSAETCDGVDQDCDGERDEGLAVADWFPDADGDGFGDAAAAATASCRVEPGHVLDATDCRDDDPDVHPGAPEACDGEDDDCDGVADDGTVSSDWYPDGDGDGYGDGTATPVYACDPPEGAVLSGTDCDDGDATVRPGAVETCDGLDQDCDGAADDGLPFETWYADLDHDGQGDADDPGSYTCDPPEDAVTNPNDCDDSDPSVRLGAPETCDGADEDCDGEADEGLPTTTWYADADADGFGDVDDEGLSGCGLVPGAVQDHTDCDDAHAAVNPAEDESCGDGLDNDCDGTANRCALEGIGTLSSADWSYLDVPGEDATCRCYSVAAAGDVNGDGRGDLVAGYASCEQGEEEEGIAVLFVGSVAILGAYPAWTAQIDSSFVYYGWSVSGAGDVDGDGFDDVLVGAPFFDAVTANEGRVDVYSGGLFGLAPSPSWTVTGTQLGEQVGWSVASAGDVNDDGYSDVLLGMPYHDLVETDQGRATVFLGGSAGLAELPNWEYGPEPGSEMLGSAIGGVMDVNGDGYGDVVIGDYATDSGFNSNGRAYSFTGSATGLENAGAWTAAGGAAGENLGYSLSGAGDVDGDGFDDVLIGAKGYENGESDEGRALLFRGSATGLGAEPSWTFEPDQAGAAAGTSVAGAGDVDGDGYDDVLVGAPTFDGGLWDEGKVFLFRGGPDGPAPEPTWTVEGDQLFLGLGATVAGAGDVNGDGYDDVVIRGSGLGGSGLWLFLGGSI